MNSVIANGWRVYTDLFMESSVDEYIEKIKLVNKIGGRNKYSIDGKKFKHIFHGSRSLPLFHDVVNKTDYLALGFVYDSYGHLGFNRIEIRNKKAYIFIADKNYFKGKKGNVRVSIFNTCSIKYILAASFHMEDKEKFILNYDNMNRFRSGIIPYDANFVIDAEISQQTEIFKEKISFGEEFIESEMKYNRLKIHRISFDEKKCYGIIQGAEDHLFLYKIASKLGSETGKL